MHSHYPATSYNWPSPDDLCWIPRVSVLAVVEPPVPMSVGAHHYKLSTEIFSKIDGVLCMMQINQIRLKLTRFFMLFGGEATAIGKKQTIRKSKC